MAQSSLESAFSVVTQLCGDFFAFESRYLAHGYPETQARTDFIDKLLTALGWDVGHVVQKNPFEQEVKVEKNVNVGHAQKRADYALFIAPNFRDVRFYVEAKKPSHILATPDNYFQTIRYGWNSATPLAVLTDFNSLHVLDCRYRPDIETALKRAPFKFHYKELRNKERFAELYWLISREAVADGSLEKRSEELPKPSGKAIQKNLFKVGFQTIDEAFLYDLDSMREALAKSLKKDNPELDGSTLTEITQRILDRLVFLRFLEDRLIETQERVSNFGDKASPWLEFLAASRRLDQRFNGTVFKSHRLIDDPQRLKTDDTIFGDICNQLGDSTSPYDFNAIPIHILGSIYEQFLGKVITTTAKRVKLEEKPEVRRAGGVYYTPEYVVRWIVDETVGQSIRGRTPAEIAKMHFADIACGSGSFLLGVFDVLLRHHTDWYNKQSKGREKILKRDCFEDEHGALHLSLSKRIEILLNNIFGVDIDNQAVEVAHLSLYLKLLEEATTASARNYQQEMGIALLPSLAKNVVCGNSLIGTDILEADNFFDFHKPEELKLNAMDFESRFPQVFKSGEEGFDAIVGNPPYGAELTNEAKKYLRKNHPFVADRETSQYFISRGFEKLRTGGYLSYIVPNTLVLNVNAAKFRRQLLERFRLVELLDLSDVDVFRGATVRTIIPVLKKEKAPPGSEISFSKWNTVRDAVSTKSILLQSLLDDDQAWQTAARGNEGEILSKMRKGSVPLSEFLEISQGLIPYDKYRGHDKKTIENRIWHADYRKDKTYKQELRGGDVTRYRVKWNGSQWISYGEWLAAPRKPEFFKMPRLLFREITDPKSGLLHVAYTDKEFYNNPSIINGILKSEAYSLFCLLGVCNSKLMAYFHFASSPKAQKGVFPKILVNDVRNLPVPKILKGDKLGKLKRDRIAKYAEQMIVLTEKIEKSDADRDRNYYQNRRNGLDQKIDGLVFELYGLSDKDIEHVEAFLSNKTA